MLRFFHTFHRTFHDPNVYQEIVVQPLRSSFVYFTIWYVLSSVILSVVLNVTLLPRLFTDSLLVLRHLNDQYPESLELIIKDGTLTAQGDASKSLPFVISNPITSTAITNVLMVDPTIPAETISSQDTLILITENAIAIRQSPESPNHTIFRLDQLVSEPVTITKENLTKFTQTISQEFDQLYRHRWQLAPLIIAFSLLVSRTLFLAIYTLPLLLLSLFTNRPLSLILMWKIGLHTLPLTDLITLFLRLLYGRSLSWLHLFTFFGLSLLAFLSLRPRSISSL